MTQDIKQQIEVMQHYAAGGSIAWKGKLEGENCWLYLEQGHKTHKFDFTTLDYRIVGPSRVPFDAIQWLINGGVGSDQHGNLFKFEDGEFLVKGWNSKYFTSNRRSFLECLMYGDIVKPYQEPEKPVVWRKDEFTIKTDAKGNLFSKQDEKWEKILNPENIYKEIAQGKWERVDD